MIKFALIVYLFGPAVLAGYHDTQQECEQAAQSSKFHAVYRISGKYTDPESLGYACVPVKYMIGK